MALKINHYGAKGVGSTGALGLEAVITEMFVAAFCGVFAYIGYRAGILLLFGMSLTAAVLCLCAALYSIYELIRDKGHVDRHDDSELSEEQ